MNIQASHPQQQSPEFGNITLMPASSGWIARLDDRGLAAHGATQEAAVKEVEAVARLVKRLAAQWTAPPPS